MHGMIFELVSSISPSIRYGFAGQLTIHCTAYLSVTAGASLMRITGPESSVLKTV
jgi:hypothetical protein